MTDNIIAECDRKVHQLLVKIHQRLNQKFPFIQQSRELSIDQNQLLTQISDSSINYKILVAAMAIDTYTHHISQIYNEADSILQYLSICLSCAFKIKSQIQKSNNKNQLMISFNNLQGSLINMTQCASIFNPTSPYLQLYRSVISNQNKAQNFIDNIYNSLKQQNSQLKQRLRINDQKVIDLQIKLTKILQEHEQYDINPIQNTLKSYEFKAQLQKKQQEIQKMNEEFSIEIEKYNVVYETLKKELEQYKSYQNVDTLGLIQKLQTEIVRLRQQKEQQQMINQELRNRLQLITEKDLHFNNFSVNRVKSISSLSKRRAEQMYQPSQQMYQPGQYSDYSYHRRDDGYYNESNLGEDQYYYGNSQEVETQSQRIGRPRMAYNNYGSRQRGQNYQNWVPPVRNGYRY